MFQLKQKMDQNPFQSYHNSAPIRIIDQANLLIEII